MLALINGCSRWQQYIECTRMMKLWPYQMPLTFLSGDVEDLMLISWTGTSVRAIQGEKCLF